MKITAYTKFFTDLVFTGKQCITERYTSIYEIPFQKLANEFSLIIFDHDDTLTDHLGELSQKTTKLLKSLPGMGYKIAVYSNCSKKQTEKLKAVFSNSDVYVVKRSDKPDPAGFVEVMNHYNVSPNKTIMIGDRLGTDMYGAFAANIEKRILVDNFSIVFGGKRPNYFLRFFGWLERLIYFKTRKS